ncbi:MAG: glutaminase A, partial [Campylobacterota bacterium]
MNYQEILEDINKEIKPYLKKGNVADYIPALEKVRGDDFAMSIIDLDLNEYNVGSYKKLFSIQSISKVFTFALALKNYNKELYKRVGHEPSGDPFNSLVQLEYENAIPRNPFINAGAIVTTDALISKYKSATFNYILDFVKKVSDDSSLFIDNEIYKSEQKTAYRNLALINLMKSFKNIKNPTNKVMETYFQQCSIMMNTNQLAKSMLFLTNHGINPFTNELLINDSKAKRINSLMLTCGHYDASGDFAY